MQSLSPHHDMLLAIDICLGLGPCLDCLLSVLNTSDASDFVEKFFSSELGTVECKQGAQPSKVGRIPSATLRTFVNRSQNITFWTFWREKKSRKVLEFLDRVGRDRRDRRQRLQAPPRPLSLFDKWTKRV